MSGAETIAFDAAARLDRAAERPPLRFLTCGSVDDGKSTLLGRLLYEQHLILEDQLAVLEHDSGKYGTSGPEIDFSLLLDGLEAEREQRITIDVAYRYLATRRRAFVVADTPGHEQYTRNMATGASAAELAVLLVDARKGLLAQTRRHAIIVSLLGIRHAVLAVNKIDLVGFDRAVFDRIAIGFLNFAAPLGFKNIKAIPITTQKHFFITPPVLPFSSRRLHCCFIRNADSCPAINRFYDVVVGGALHQPVGVGKCSRGRSANRNWVFAAW